MTDNPFLNYPCPMCKLTTIIANGRNVCSCGWESRIHWTDEERAQAAKEWAEAIAEDDRREEAKWQEWAMSDALAERCYQAEHDNDCLDYGIRSPIRRIA